MSGGFATYDSPWPWRATYELRGPAEGLTLAPRVLERLRSLLAAELRPEIIAGPDGLLTVRVMVSANQGGEAGYESERVVFRALTDAGVPDEWDVVRSEFVRGDELERRYGPRNG